MKADTNTWWQRWSERLVDQARRAAAYVDDAVSRLIDAISSRRSSKRAA